MKRSAVHSAAIDIAVPGAVAGFAEPVTSRPRIEPSTDTFMEEGGMFCNTVGGGGAGRGQRKKWEDDDEINSLIAKELLQLSLRDREILFEDIHGVADPVEETEELMRNMLNRMQTAINWIKEKAAYEQARFMLPSSVEDRFLRIAILRASLYDPIKAAHRIVKYFQLKLRIFGLDLLVRPIRQVDLTEGMTRYLRSGAVQVLPSRDRVGRPIMFMAAKFEYDVAFEDIAGVMWYLYSKLIRDESYQKKGCVIVHYNFENSEMMASELASRAQKAPELDSAVPLKIAAVHFCYDNEKLRPIMAMVQVALKTSTRLRFKLHYGSSLECSYKLMTYGIVSSSLPIASSGSIDNTVWEATVGSMRKDNEFSMETLDSTLIIPNSRDCLLGRGWPFRSFPGNIDLIDMIKRNRPFYMKQSIANKRQTIQAIIWYFLQIRGSRFLKKIVGDENEEMVGSSWVMASDGDILSKVAKMIRRTPDSNDTPVDGESVQFVCDNGMTILVPAASNRA